MDDSILWNYRRDIWGEPHPDVWVTYTITSDGANELAPAAPAETCAHDAPLLKVTDGIAYCDGCGRSFELREFGS